jgi:hypothetical protein
MLWQMLEDLWVEIQDRKRYGDAIYKLPIRVKFLTAAVVSVDPRPDRRGENKETHISA